VGYKHPPLTLRVLLDSRAAASLRLDLKLFPTSPSRAYSPFLDRREGLDFTPTGGACGSLSAIVEVIASVFVSERPLTSRASGDFLTRPPLWTYVGVVRLVVLFFSFAIVSLSVPWLASCRHI